MNIEELHKKVELIRMVSDDKMKYLRDHSKLLDQAFEELKGIHDEELDLIYDKIQDLDEQLDKNGLS